MLIATPDAPAPGTTPEPWREVKKRKTRDALVAAARTLVSDEGLDAVTIDAICQQAGVSRRTFFNYFETKEDAFLDFPEHTIAPGVVETFCDGGPSGDLPEDVRALVHGILENTSVRFDEFRTLVPIIHAEPRLVTRQMRWFDEQLSSINGLVATRLGPQAGSAQCQVVALAIVALVRGTILAWEANDLEGQPDSYIDVAFTHLRSVYSGTHP